jgi:hypothetical protein
MLLLFTILSNSFADDTEQPRVIYKEVTTLEFEDFELEGSIKKPAGEMILERRLADFSPMIDLRTDFNKEMEMSISQIK